jgi:hypothetical protein
MSGLEYTKETAKRLEKTISRGMSRRSGRKQFGNSICPVVRVFWISDVARAICAKAWGNSSGVMVPLSASIFRPI